MVKSNWTMDPTHSAVGFKVKHIMFTNISGKLKSFQVNIENYDKTFENSKISFLGQVNSIDTGNEERDKHLKSTDFFDTENFPEISFYSTKITKINDDIFKVLGDLTIKNVTKNLTLEVEYSGLLKDPWGNLRIALSVSGTINRKDFGLSWNTTLESGGVLISETTHVFADTQFIKN